MSVLQLAMAAILAVVPMADDSLEVRGSRDGDRNTLVQKNFKAFINDPSFPCLGAKGALRQGGCTITLYGELGSALPAGKLAADLSRFSASLSDDTPGLSAVAAAFSSGCSNRRDYDFTAALLGRRSHPSAGRDGFDCGYYCVFR